MIHDRQRLPLRLEALHDRLVVHPRLDQLERNLPPHRGGLFGQPDLSHASFTKLADELKTFRKERSRLQASAENLIGIRDEFVGQWGALKEARAGVVAGGEQDFDFLP